MKNFRFLSLFAALLCSIAIPSSVVMAQATGNTSINTVNTTQMVSDQTALAALEAAAKASGKAVITGKYYTIPLSALSGAITYMGHLNFSHWLACKQICMQYQIWANSHKRTPPFIDQPAFDVKINVVDASGTLIMVVTVPFAAKCNSINSKGVASGYVAPMGSQGATMKLDVFGDGSLVLEKFDCPCP